MEGSGIVAQAIVAAAGSPGVCLTGLIAVSDIQDDEGLEGARVDGAGHVDPCGSGGAGGASPADAAVRSAVPGAGSTRPPPPHESAVQPQRTIQQLRAGADLDTQQYLDASAADSTVDPATFFGLPQVHAHPPTLQ